MALTSFAAVQKILNGIVITTAPHGAFWQTSYGDFVNGDVPGGSMTANPNTGQPLPILIKGDGPNSNIIMALAGTAGSFWDPNTGYFGRMPYNGPYLADAVIQELSDWITNGCPEMADAGATQAAETKAAASPALPSFAAVQKFLNDFIADNGIQIGGAPHGAFWQTSYSNFVNGNVPGGAQTANPNTGQPLPILIKGDGPNSNIIMALAGTAGSFWDPNTGAFGQMPPGGPFMTTDMINQISGWITNGCPETAKADDA